MITDRKALASIVQKWESVRVVQAGLSRQWFVEGVQVCEEAPDEAYNLPFVLAYAVLDEVLKELRDQGVFVCRGWKRKHRDPSLGRMMEDSRSRSSLLWQDYGLVFKGKEERNRLAHGAKLARKADCLAYIDAIEAELKAWKIV